jgi:hypothetical protein
MLAVSMPKRDTSAAFVETATKCLATDFSSPPRPASDHWRAVRALVIALIVVKVFEDTMKMVSAGSIPRIDVTLKCAAVQQVTGDVSQRLWPRSCSCCVA